MNKNGNKYYTDSLAGMLIFGLFAACIILSLLAGAGAYKRLTQRDQAAYEKRTCVQYIAAKIKNAPAPGSITVVDDGAGGTALRIEDNLNEEKFATYIYCYDGWICELLVPAEADPVFSAGERLLEAKSLTFKHDGTGMITTDVVTQSGEESELLISLGSSNGRGGNEE